MDLSPQIILTNFFAIIISLTVHEFAHAWTADRMGDPTPGRYDRLNLNPLTIMRAHPFGALLVPLISSLNGFLIGWAATPVNPHLVNRKYTLRQAERWISLAGPLSNVLLALLTAISYVLLEMFSPESGEVALWLAPLKLLMQTLVFTNIFLALFNMVPVMPLDGFTVLESSLPRSLSHIPRMIREKHNMILIFVLFFGGRILAPIAYSSGDALIRFVYRLIA